MKRFLIIFLMAGSVATVLAKSGNAQQEYNQLLMQCQAIKAKILSDNSFAPIAAQARQNLQQTNQAIAERFTGGFGVPGAASAQRSSGFTQALNAASGDLESNLAVLEAEHNVKVRNLIINCATLYLRNVGTASSMKLLSDLALNNFNF